MRKKVKAKKKSRGILICYSKNGKIKRKILAKKINDFDRQDDFVQIWSQVGLIFF